MVPLDSLAVRSLRSWLGEPTGPGLLALHHALTYQRPGLWGDHARVPRSVVLVREGDDQLEAFGAGYGVPHGPGFAALAWVFDQSAGFDSIGVYTVPRYRRLGLGRAAAAALITHIARRRGKIPLWSTTPDNDASLALAASLGFT